VKKVRRHSEKELVEIHDRPRQFRGVVVRFLLLFPCLRVMLNVLAFFAAPLEKAYNKQYSSTFEARARAMTSSFLAHLPAELRDMKKWALLREVSDYPPNEPIYISGLLYKDLPAHPWALDEYDPDKKRMSPLVTADSFLSDKDEIILEEPTGTRIHLQAAANSDVDLDRLPPGVFVAVKGRLVPGSDTLIVTALWTVGPLPNPVPLPCSLELLPGPTPTVLFLSCLGVSKEALPAELATLRNVVSYVEENKVALVVLAGGLYCTESYSKSDMDSRARLLFDAFLCECSSRAQVLLMPGEDDCSTFLWPQQPLFSCLFPSTKAKHGCRMARMPVKADDTDASRLRVVLAHNPAAFDFAGVSFLGTSGKNVRSVLQTTKGLSVLDAMEGMLNWQHICPTAPTYLPTAPILAAGKDLDPFVLEYTPHVFFCGGQKEASAKLATLSNQATCALMGVPEFSKTQKGLLYDTRNNSVQCLDWSV